MTPAIDTILDATDTPIIKDIDPALVTTTLSIPPFVQVDRLVNARTLPLPPSASRGLILRSGEPNHMSDSGKSALVSLGITKIFDLRSAEEIAKFKTEIFAIDGVEIVHAPAMREVEQKDDMKSTFEKFGGRGDEGFIDFYKSVLNEGQEAFKEILKFIRDEVPKGKGCLFHCTGGKDRTGMAAMIILDLVSPAQVSDEEIVRDYALTRIAMEPLRGLMATRFRHILEDEKVRDSAINGFSSRPSVMRLMLQEYRKPEAEGGYGGSQNYLKKLGFEDEDIDKIRNVLVGTA